MWKEELKFSYLMQVSVLHDFSRHCFMCVVNWRPLCRQRCRQSDQKSFTSETSAANDMSIKVSLSKTLNLCCTDMSISPERLFKNRPSLSRVKARWSRSAGWTALWSSGETVQSFRCRFGWLTGRAACSPAPRSAWEINSSTSSSARPGPFSYTDRV